MRYLLVEEKNDDLFRKNANLREKRWKNGKKEEIFTEPSGKNIFEKREGAKFHNMSKYSPLILGFCKLKLRYF